MVYFSRISKQILLFSAEIILADENVIDYMHCTVQFLDTVTLENGMTQDRP